MKQILRAIILAFVIPGIVYAQTPGCNTQACGTNLGNPSFPTNPPSGFAGSDPSPPAGGSDPGACGTLSVSTTYKFTQDYTASGGDANTCFTIGHDTLINCNGHTVNGKFFNNSSESGILITNCILICSPAGNGDNGCIELTGGGTISTTVVIRYVNCSINSADLNDNTNCIHTDNGVTVTDPSGYAMNINHVTVTASPNGISRQGAINIVGNNRTVDAEFNAVRVPGTTFAGQGLLSQSKPKKGHLDNNFLYMDTNVTQGSGTISTISRAGGNPNPYTITIPGGMSGLLATVPAVHNGGTFILTGVTDSSFNINCSSATWTPGTSTLTCQCAATCSNQSAGSSTGGTATADQQSARAILFDCAGCTVDPGGNDRDISLNVIYANNNRATRDRDVADVHFHHNEVRNCNVVGLGCVHLYDSSNSLEQDYGDCQIYSNTFIGTAGGIVIHGLGGKGCTSHDNISQSATGGIWGDVATFSSGNAFNSNINFTNDPVLANPNIKVTGQSASITASAMICNSGVGQANGAFATVTNITTCLTTATPGVVLFSKGDDLRYGTLNAAQRNNRTIESAY